MTSADGNISAISLQARSVELSSYIERNQGLKRVTKSVTVSATCCMIRNYKEIADLTWPKKRSAGFECNYAVNMLNWAHPYACSTAYIQDFLQRHQLLG